MPKPRQNKFVAAGEIVQKGWILVMRLLNAESTFIYVVSRSKSISRGNRELYCVLLEPWKTQPFPHNRNQKKWERNLCAHGSSVKHRLLWVSPSVIWTKKKKKRKSQQHSVAFDFATHKTWIWNGRQIQNRHFPPYAHSESGCPINLKGSLEPFYHFSSSFPFPLPPPPKSVQI